jgi:DNA polymerase-3 subunit epsilon
MQTQTYFENECYLNMQAIDLNNTVILDTETTGLDNCAEICEISVIDTISGEAILNTLIKPKGKIPEEVIAIHGITNEMVNNVPSYADIHSLLINIFNEKRVIIYNAGYDLRLIQQSAAQYDFLPLINPKSIFCAMTWYAEFYGQWDKKRDNFKWQKLMNAAKQQDVDTSDLKAHRALADCEITRRVVNTVNRKLA